MDNMDKGSLEQILVENDFSKVARLVLYTLFTYQDKNGSSIASYATIAKLCGIHSNTSISKAIKELETCEIITVTKRAYNSNVYSFIL